MQSYRFEQDHDGTMLETILTAPMVVAEWINTQYLFSTLDNVAFGSRSKVTHNVVGTIGVMQGNGSDLMHGLPLQSVMEEAKVTGFTLFRNVSGKGHNGFHEGKILFNDRASLVMFLAVAPEEIIAPLALGMKTLFQQNSGVMFVSDVDVAHMDYFSSVTGA